MRLPWAGFVEVRALRAYHPSLRCLMNHSPLRRILAPLLLAIGGFPLLAGAQAIAVPAADFHIATRTRVPMGVNLEMVLDYSRSMMFVDALKSARKFGSADKPWDEAAPVDAH